MEQLYKKVGKKYEPINLNLDDTILLFCAFRYALGRMTYVVDSVATSIRRAAAYLDVIEKNKYVQEIIEHYERFGDIGMNMDTDVWLKLACFLDEGNSYDIEANFYQTDRWDAAENTYKYKGQYYSRSDEKGYYHTVRNIKEKNTNYRTRDFAEMENKTEYVDI